MWHVEDPELSQENVKIHSLLEIQLRAGDRKPKAVLCRRAEQDSSDFRVTCVFPLFIFCILLPV